MAGELVRDVRATLDIEVAKAQAGLRDLERAGDKSAKALGEQERAAKGYERQLEKTGTAANTMRRRLEAATRALPKITVGMDASEADTKLANLRETLHGLAGQKIGIDVNGADALEEMHRIKAELQELAQAEADPIVRADIAIALRELERVDAELGKLGAEEVTVPVEVEADTRALGATATAIRAQLEAATAALPDVEIGADSTEADIKIAALRDGLASLSGKTVGVDIDSTAALAEVAVLRAELEALDNDDIDPVVRADVRQALDGLSKVESSLGAVGQAAETSMGVLGKAGPANVAIAASAIAALPAVAELAAAGIVFALGAGLATVGLTQAAQADEVRHAWAQAADAIQDDLADAAQPLEGSAKRAADVAQESFERLKPTLSRIFADLVPDVDRFIDAVGDGVVRLAPGLERIGDSFGNLLGGLADRMPDIMNSLNGAFTTFSDIMDKNPTMLADAVAAAGELLEVGADVLSWADEIQLVLSAPLGPAGSSTGNNYFWEKYFGISYDEFVEQAGEFPGYISQIHNSLGVGIDAIRNAGDAGNDAAGGVRNFKDSLEELFDPAQKALDAEIRLKEALQNAAKAAKDSSLTEIERLRSVQDLTRAIADGAKAEHERTGKTTEAAKAFADQLPKLVEWAGKNDAARDAVVGLGDSLGVTIKRADDGSIAVDKFGKAVVTLPSGKTVKVDADTAKALAAILKTRDGLNELKNRTVYVDVITREQAVRKQDNLKAAKGALIQYAAAGGITAYAAGGMQPHIVNKPTAIVYGEGSTGRGAREAFIPLDEYRPEAIDLLSQVAQSFGFNLYGREADQQVREVATTVSDAAADLGVAIGTTDDTLVGTFGQAGTLTSALDGVGTAGTEMATSWTTGSTQIGDAVGLMSGEVSGSVTSMASSTSAATHELTRAVVDLGTAVSATLSKTTASKGGGGVSATLTKTMGESGYELKREMVDPDAFKPEYSVAGSYESGGQGFTGPGSASQLVADSTLRSVPVASSASPSASLAGSGSGSMVSIATFNATPNQSPHDIAQELSWISR